MVRYHRSSVEFESLLYMCVHVWLVVLLLTANVYKTNIQKNTGQ